MNVDHIGEKAWVVNTLNQKVYKDSQIVFRMVSKSSLVYFTLEDFGNKPSAFWWKITSS